MGWRIGKCCKLIWVLGVTFALLAGKSMAAEWEIIRDNGELSALFSDTEMTATLKEGVEATSTYNSDGTGSLKAWGGSYSRQWKVEEGSACLLIDAVWRCFDVERNISGNGEYRATVRGSGERVVFMVSGSHMRAQGAVGGSNGGAVAPTAEEVAKQLANPNTPLATLTTRVRFTTFEGDLPGAHKQSGTTVLLQPSFPFPTEGGGVVFFRPGIPLVLNQPVFEAGEMSFDEEAGLGDISFDLGYGYTNKETGLLLAAGMVSTLPTATDDALGNDRITLGPEFLIGLLTDKYVLGAFPNHQWDIGGSGDKDINLTSVQLFGILLAGGGWTVGTAPILSHDWEESQSTIPLNVDIGKTVIFGGRPWKLGVGINYYVEQADSFGPEWMIEFNVAPVVENVMARWFQ